MIEITIERFIELIRTEERFAVIKSLSALSAGQRFRRCSTYAYLFGFERACLTLDISRFEAAFCMYFIIHS